MSGRSQKPVSAEARGVRQALLDAVQQWPAGDQGFDEAVPGLRVVREKESAFRIGRVLQPSITLVVQGLRQMTIGSSSFTIRGFGLLVTSLPLPVTVDLSTAGGDERYLAVEAIIDTDLLEQVRSDLTGRVSDTSSSISLAADAPAWMLDCLTRMLGLSGEDHPAAALVELIRKELLVRLLGDTLGTGLHQLAVDGSHVNRVYRAIKYIGERFRQQLVISDLATYCGWSPSSLHHHFRSLTSTTPLQFQQFLRLSEARQLLLTAQVQASEAARQVGYSSANQFNREYRRLFGVPPMTSVKSMPRYLKGDLK
ncbi:AraC family transcriptional regulator [Rhizobium sp. Rhizsp42]|uniref:AraC family transcriptional regulator n=1 Tax=Rhizobium sp. Rhizsp42 TaxID=3243034 RepID=UPI0039AEB102